MTDDIQRQSQSATAESATGRSQVTPDSNAARRPSARGITPDLCVLTGIGFFLGGFLLAAGLVLGISGLAAIGSELHRSQLSFWLWAFGPGVLGVGAGIALVLGGFAGSACYRTAAVAATGVPPKMRFLTRELFEMRGRAAVALLPLRLYAIRRWQILHVPDETG